MSKVYTYVLLVLQHMSELFWVAGIVRVGLLNKHPAPSPVTSEIPLTRAFVCDNL